MLGQSACWRVSGWMYESYIMYSLWLQAAFYTARFWNMRPFSGVWRDPATPIKHVAIHYIFRNIGFQYLVKIIDKSLRHGVVLTHHTMHADSYIGLRVPMHSYSFRSQHFIMLYIPITTSIYQLYISDATRRCQHWHVKSSLCVYCVKWTEWWRHVVWRHCRLHGRLYSKEHT